MLPLLREPGPANARPELYRQVETAIRENHAGEPVLYDLTLVLVAQNTQPAAAYLLVLSTRSPLLSPPRIASTFLIMDACPTPAMISHAVKICLAALYEARKNLVSAGPQAQYHPGAN